MSMHLLCSKVVIGVIRLSCPSRLTSFPRSVWGDESGPPLSGFLTPSASQPPFLAYYYAILGAASLDSNHSASHGHGGY